MLNRYYFKIYIFQREIFKGTVLQHLPYTLMCRGEIPAASMQLLQQLSPEQQSDLLRNAVSVQQQQNLFAQGMKPPRLQTTAAMTPALQAQLMQSNKMQPPVRVLSSFNYNVMSGFVSCRSCPLRPHQLLRALRSPPQLLWRCCKPRDNERPTPLRRDSSCQRHQVNRLSRISSSTGPRSRRPKHQSRRTRCRRPI